MIEQIIWFLSWPALIYLSYRLTLLALKRFESNKDSDQAV